jgi:hypothetical protein
MADDPSAQSDDQLGLSLSNWCGCLKPLTETVSKLSHAFHFRSSAGALGWSVGYVEIGVRNSVTGNRPALVAKGRFILPVRSSTRSLSGNRFP